MKRYSKVEAFRISDELIDPDALETLTPYGYAVWPLLRELVCSSMLQRQSLPVNPRAHTTSLNRLRGLLGPVSVTSIAKLLLNRRKDNLFFCADTCLRKQNGGVVNIILDPIRARLSDSCLLEWHRDTSIAARRSQRGSLIAVGGFGFSGASAPTGSHVPHYRELFSLLEKNGLAEEYRYVEMSLDRYARYLRVATNLLKIVKPKRIFLVSAYGPKMRALLKIANTMGIDTIECQHGSIHKYHPAYIFGDRDLTGARELLPNRLLVFGEYFRDLLKTESPHFCSDRILIMGYPFLDEAVRLAARRHPRRSDNKPCILVTSHNSHADAMLPFVLRLAQERPDVEFIYKLHPGERPDDERFQTLQSARNIRVVSDYLVSVYDLFEECHVHVSATSTCSFEALRFGIPSILLDLGEDSDPFAELIDDKTWKSVPDDASAFFHALDQFQTEKALVKEACLKRSAQFFSQYRPACLEQLFSH